MTDENPTDPNELSESENAATAPGDAALDDTHDASALLGTGADAFGAADETADSDTAGGTGAAGAVPVQYGVGPFSLREVILAGVWLVAFVISFFSTREFVFSSVWTSGIDWILTIGVPTVAVFLLVLRRLSPTGIRRVGSLGIDQFASVAFSVSAVIWLGQLWSQVAVAIAGGPWVLTWVSWVEFILMLAGVVLTVGAVLIPGLAEDFQHRAETVSHRAARTVRPITARPHPVGGAASSAGASAASGRALDGGTAAYDAGAADTGSYDTAPDGGAEQSGFSVDSFAPATDTGAQPVAQAPAQQAFWALVPQERDVVDENGTPLFRIGPTAWALVIEDRGSSYVIRHEDGRVGQLHDISGVTRG
nr:hypothetical protein [Microbacterium bovistercoris]